MGVPVLWSATDSDIADIVAAAEQVARRAVAVQTAAVAEGLRRGLPARAGAAGATGWLSGLTGVKPQQAHRVCRLAAGLDQVPATAAALAAGRVDPDQAQVICGAVAGLPDDVGAGLRVEAEAWLLDQAQVHHAGVLAGLAAHPLEVVAPEIAEQKLAERLARDEARAEDRRDRLSARPNWRGRITVRGDFAPDTWATVAAALDPFTKPAPAHHPDPDHNPGGDAGGDAGGVGVSDRRSYDQRLADGLVELARRQLLTGDLPVRGGNRPQVVVTIDHDRRAPERSAVGL